MVTAMDKVQSELADLKSQGETVAESLKTMAEALKSLNTWMPQVDGTIGNLQRAVDEVGEE